MLDALIEIYCTSQTYHEPGHSIFLLWLVGKFLRPLVVYTYAMLVADQSNFARGGGGEEFSRELLSVSTPGQCRWKRRKHLKPCEYNIPQIMGVQSLALWSELANLYVWYIWRDWHTILCTKDLMFIRHVYKIGECFSLRLEAIAWWSATGSFADKTPYLSGNIKLSLIRMSWTWSDEMQMLYSEF